MKSPDLTAYGKIQALLTLGECVLLDGGVATEVTRTTSAGSRYGDESLETWAIYDQTNRVLNVHRQYAMAGCDVISTNTWGLLSAAKTDRGRRPGRTGLPTWTVMTRDAVTLARRGIAEAGRTGDCAVAFCMNDADPLLAGTEELLELLWGADPPDLLLVETLRTLPSPGLLLAIAGVAATGLPVWMSFKHSPDDGDQDSDAFRAALSELVGCGVQAILVNCISPDRTTQVVGELAASSSVPVGCYPRLDGPRHPQAYAELSREWFTAGARIIGGCCGVEPCHIAAVREALAARAATTS